MLEWASAAITISDVKMAYRIGPIASLEFLQRCFRNQNKMRPVYIRILTLQPNCDRYAHHVRGYGHGGHSDRNSAAMLIF